MANLAASLVGKRNATLGLERMNANVAIALKELGLDIVDAQQAIETVRTFKSPEEVKCIVASLRATEVAVGRLRDAVSPGLAENQLWSVMHKSLIEQNGDYVETRLLTAGPRANTWFQESASYAISKNDLVVLDTDVVNHNMRIVRPDLTFGDYTDLAWDIPEQYWANRYFVSAHGCGLTEEDPYLHHRGDFPDSGYDGVIEPGMVLCVESYIGNEGGTQGVKLERQS
ncbi:uncharacterized protein FFB20_14546 [Fusarium fujikuroi]|uniref:Peptidase M24 domain-containing protein n=2 Tax=Fusarium fujikuroi TaxID=5127 RepID=S0E1H5_GIBF5|nr:uncharacterized protein FFUJ_07412 [Fusarium fujikuroi IMI 58289]KLO90978.1 uncharacterized protein LW94_3158 [Fusarium fujikuroi]KLO98228.1 uncharacterized protein Y057_15014 [Fusarium fujikuroi]QGI64550.1 hypothetical protein CEK27_008521 [Fusarium fujikuroi]QGI81814.1 hypothetical protein CEK25_008543 [Fusarium fujikuroi]QGI95435.1 hypothetical protein CEK26_008504 [Fusarium fujikuroi]